LRTVILIERRNKRQRRAPQFSIQMCITEPLNQKYSVISTKIKNIAESCGNYRYEPMIALLPLILLLLFVITDIHEKVKIRRLKCIRMMRNNKHFPKNSCFFTI
jgi:hypothetical protein